MTVSEAMQVPVMTPIDINGLPVRSVCHDLVFFAMGMGLSLSLYRVREMLAVVKDRQKVQFSPRVDRGGLGGGGLH
ncbi:hypothetical protein [Streptomyces sp. NPDC005970]|uniref:hypothetical protein n=1 Tax=Streptomyces sp. NPDC005970 TaxID=3156723 RepID=UPI0033F8663E